MTTSDRRKDATSGEGEAAAGAATREKRRKQEKKLDTALAATFPASDPVASGKAMGGPRAKKPVLPDRDA